MLPQTIGHISSMAVGSMDATTCGQNSGTTRTHISQETCVGKSCSQGFVSPASPAIPPPGQIHKTVCIACTQYGHVVSTMSSPWLVCGVLEGGGLTRSKHQSHLECMWLGATRCACKYTQRACNTSMQCVTCKLYAHAMW